MRPSDRTRTGETLAEVQHFLSAANFETHQEMLVAVNRSVASMVAIPRAAVVAGESRAIEELRVADLYELHDFADSTATLMPDLRRADELDLDARRATLAGAYRAATVGWPGDRPSKATELVDDPAVRPFFLYLMLRRHEPAITVGQAADLAPAVTPAEWAKLIRVGLALTPLMEIVAELVPDPVIVFGHPFDPIDDLSPAAFAKAAGVVADPDAIGRLTVNQWRAIQFDGQRVEQSPTFLDAASRARKILAVTPPTAGK